ncbi:porin [Candidatus Pelagibacter sp.]|nr:porin [Candidatus Pelagibacter sp.]
MNNLKKIGLTALAGSLVVTSAFAGELTASGSASMGVANISGTAADGLGKNFSMANSVYLAGSGEMDNGMTVSVSFELDNGVDTGTGTGPFDNHYVEVGSDALGTLRLSGHGGSSAQSAVEVTAAGDLWNNTLGLNGSITNAEAGDNNLFYTLPEMMDGLALTASMAPGDAAATDTHMSYAAVYTGVEGLTVKYGTGDWGTKTAGGDATTMSASYAIGSLTASVSNSESDSIAANTDVEVSSYQIAYTVSEDISITYGSETFDKDGSAVDEEITGYGISYTTGGMTLSGSMISAEGAGNDATGDTDKWSLTAAFAF